MAGGAPAGINIRPGELGCLTNRTRMRTMTRTGKMTTTPRGTEIEEFPRKRRGRLRKARRAARPFCLAEPLFSSRVGSWAWLVEVEGTILEALRKRSMVVYRQSPPGGRAKYEVTTFFWRASGDCRNQVPRRSAVMSFARGA